VLAGLEAKELVQRLPRQPGRREERFGHLLGEAADAGPTEVPAESAAPFEQRLAQLEARVAELERLLAR
jgi:uncharacterized protein YceH (UPF0502 family)